MKDQYFGDVNDFRKYGLLRALTAGAGPGLRLGVCWMLTPSDGRSDGKFVSYLRSPNVFRHHDPELFDWLAQAVHEEGDRRTARIAGSGMLGSAVYHPAVLPDDAAGRAAYFASGEELFAGCDLVFFDPDNGLETGNKRRGNKDSCKYLFWPEVESAFAAGSSVLVYQHFIREERERFIARKAEELMRATSAHAVFVFRTSHVVFLLAAQKRHAAVFRGRLGAIRASWGAQIGAAEHGSAV